MARSAQAQLCKLPTSTWLLRSTVVCTPLALAVLACVGTRQMVQAAPFALPTPILLLVMGIIAGATVAACEKVGRRILPVEILVDLTNVLPDQAPAKLTGALRATSPRHLREAARSDDPDRALAATQIIDLTRQLTAHDRLTRGHSERVSAVSTMLADEMGITGEARDRLQWGALLHDVGKIGVAPAILNKPSQPSDAEWAELQQHPAGGAVLAHHVSQWLGDGALVIEQHHERFDGTGYPRGLSGEQINLAARIVAVADAYEVMTGSRSYQAAMSPSQARAELVAASGTHFDPGVVRAFASLSVPRLHPTLGSVAWAIAVLI